tara:strand:+ start:391 stop:675 length:285 start_codon:yes stop_codon:yes gene_type:complete
MAPKKKTTAATKTAPWEEASKAKSSKAKVVEPEFPMTVQMYGTLVSLSFDSKESMERAVQAVSLRCARGMPATVECKGTEYTFVPGVGVITSPS